MGNHGSHAALGVVSVFDGVGLRAVDLLELAGGVVFAGGGAAVRQGDSNGVVDVVVGGGGDQETADAINGGGGGGEHAVLCVVGVAGGAGARVSCAAESTKYVGVGIRGLGDGGCRVVEESFAHQLSSAIGLLPLGAIGVGDSDGPRARTAVDGFARGGLPELGLPGFEAIHAGVHGAYHRWRGAVISSVHLGDGSLHSGAVGGEDRADGLGDTVRAAEVDDAVLIDVNADGFLFAFRIVSV